MTNIYLFLFLFNIPIQFNSVVFNKSVFKEVTKNVSPAKVFFCSEINKI